jgi:ectoine hydroxylase-related dioxygenase (phytanoyl-CoA dioxygenase family)
MLASGVAEFESRGFVVLRAFIDPAALSAEFDATMRDAFGDERHLNEGSAENQFRYVPTMCERTPVSLALVRRLSGVAAALLHAPVLPVRAKATTYFGATMWHRDTDLAVRSVGFAFYLDALDTAQGALRVLPGSHRPPLDTALDRHASPGGDVSGVGVPTLPGDAIAFDERLYHASSGGLQRRQWRVDFVADVSGADDALRAYFAGQYVPGWDGGYDVGRFPSYGDHWRTLDPRWNERLDDLGAYRAAAGEEAFARARRGTRGQNGATDDSGRPPA